ncbi:MAG: chemotaxis-specific protein-glutamate methyltransferase CheB [Candidatus Altiarchaeota archaeon]|nr:chemotaxis-specific protein-glutamate methyltransferase CheB [Candidatus Altiarchaeota archaeon]
MIKVLIIADSYFFGVKLTCMLESEPEIKVIHRSGLAEEALDKIELLEPDVVLLDIEMKGVHALDILYNIMLLDPTPTIVVGRESDLGRREMLSALGYGAVDFIVMPNRLSDLEEMKEELIALVRVASSLEIKKLVIKKPKKKLSAPKISEKVLVLGASCGGVATIRTILSSFPKDFPAAVLVVQHMPAGFTKAFAETLDAVCPLKVEEAKEGSLLDKGKVLVAPGGYNLEVVQKGKHLFTQLNKKHTIVKPCIDVTLKSVSKVCGKNVIAVILTGMGDDGANGVKWVKKNGGKIIVQDESTSLIFGMPKMIIRNGDADFILPLLGIADKIVEIL